LFAFRGDRHPTSFPQRSDRSALGCFRSRIIGFAKIRFVAGRMRAAVSSGLIVRGLGNFRRVGVAGDSMERLSVVRRFRTVIVRVHVRNTRADVRETCAQMCIRTLRRVPTREPGTEDTSTRISHLKLPLPSPITIIHTCDSVNSLCGVMCNTHLIVRDRTCVCNAFVCTLHASACGTHTNVHMHAYKANLVFYAT